jgi:protocatechuate 3,4-dioxygenase alpha subunit
VTPATPGQTVGPFFHFALPYPGDRELVAPGTSGSIQLHGRVLDGAGDPVPDALIEIWQPDADGQIVQRSGSLRRDGYTFTGFGRSSTDREGEYSFTTLVPGSIDGALPYFAVTVFARGLLHRLFTRAYLPLEPNTTDEFLTNLDPERRHTVQCVADDQGFVFDIRLMGDDETVFLRYPGH